MPGINRTALMIGALVVAAAGPGRAQSADSASAAPIVETWGDSVTLQPIGIALRLPADGVQWMLQPDGKSLVGSVPGERPINLSIWSYARSSTCDGFVAVQRGQMEQSRRLGMRVPREETRTNPAWLPQGAGWNSLVWMGNACRDGVRDALVITVRNAQDLRGRAVEATRTMLWYLGDAAARAGR